MTDIEIKKYAIIGMNVRIDFLEDSIERGQQILQNRANGKFTDKSPKNDFEIRNVIREKQIERKQLISKRDDLDWELILNDKNN